MTYNDLFFATGRPGAIPGRLFFLRFFGLIGAA